MTKTEAATLKPGDRVKTDGFSIMTNPPIVNPTETVVSVWSSGKVAVSFPECENAVSFPCSQLTRVD